MKSTIACPRCGEKNSGDTLYCIKCNAALPGADDSSTMGGAPPPRSEGDDSATMGGAPPPKRPTVDVDDSATMGGAPPPKRPADDNPATMGGAPPKRPASSSPRASSLDDLYRGAATITGGTPIPAMERGTLLANGRYEIQALLGQGAMGAVYKAKDLELDRWVALKVIQPELVSSPAILKRFKQELILARQITHRNVVRIFDIGETDGMKFITMEYVDGGDLKSRIIEEGKMPAEEVVGIIRQICHALDAAHSEGVVHRDLKPQNIMMDQTGRVVVMDFGIAHSKDMPGMTMTGALMGTPEYMSPEQAKGEKTDLRADIFAVGIIFYEMLIGKVPFKSNTVVETMYKRTQERAVPPLNLDSSIPVQANQIVMKCLETDPANRYQNAKELLQDLDVFDPEKKLSAVDRMRRRVTRRAISWKPIAIAAMAALIVVAAVFMLRNRFVPKPEVAHAPVTILVADFSNHTGDAVFDGTLESTLKLALEGASFISAFDRTKLRDLGVPRVSALDESKAQEIAASQGLNVVVAGSLDRSGADYRLSLRAVQAVTGKVLANANETAPTKDQVLFAVTKLGTTMRRALGDSTSESDQRLSMESLSAASIEAVHDYAAALDALSAGKFEEAQKRASQAVDLDPNFGMAYTVMASISRNQGHIQDAVKSVREAIKNTGHMTERERYRTRAYLYLLTGDQQKCVDEYGSLLERYPSDTGAYTNIAQCFLHLHNIPKALEAARRASAILPKRTIYHANLAYFSAYAGDFQTAAKEAGETQKLGFAAGVLYEGYVALAQGQVDKADEAYRKFQKVNPSEATTAFADLALYEGRYKEAKSILEQGVTADMAPRDPSPDSASAKLWMLAYIHYVLGEKGPALAATKRALELSNAFQTRFMAGRVYVGLGETAKAKELAAALSKELQIEPQAYAKLIEGEAALQSGDARGAVNLFKQGNELLDTWIGRFDLGRAYLELGAFPEADSEFERCLQRRGEVLTLFLDLSTYGFFPPVYYYQGRVREGLKTSGSAESYKTYLSIRGKAGEDPLLAEVRRRAGQ